MTAGGPTAGTVLFDFSDRDLDAMVAGCTDDAMMAILLASVPAGAAVLEAGAGSGRWVKALADRGYAVTGIELNRPDVERFRARFPGLAFDHGDVEALPYPDAAFDAVLSFGVIEHLFAGCEQALREAHRVLRPGGLLVLTVPHANALFRLEGLKDPVLHRLWGSRGLRRLLGRPPAPFDRRGERRRLAAIRRDRRPGWGVKLGFAPDRGRDFYEYRFTDRQLHGLVAAAGLTVEDTRHLYQADRLYQVFGRLAGRFDGHSPVRLNAAGRLLARLLPASWSAHMLLVLARKPG